MPRFFFDFSGGDESARDEVGCEFETLELAYLDAYQSMVRIGADLLLEQKDPSGQRIDISNERGVVLMSLPFDEVFQRRASGRPIDRLGATITTQLDTSRRLGSEIRAACDEARALVAAARATLGRVSASQVTAEQGP